MGSYPWGPHGPQSGPNQVTPNPTPAWVPPPAPSGGSWSPPAPSYGGGGGGAAPNYGGVAAGGYVRRKKSYILGVILPALFGPFGLMYVTFRGALLMVGLMLATPYMLARMGAYGPAFQRMPLNIIGREAVMNGWWTLAAMISLVWCVIGVWRHNRNV